MTCVCGCPCRRRSGGPLPPWRTQIVASGVAMRVRVKVGNMAVASSREWSRRQACSNRICEVLNWSSTSARIRAALDCSFPANSLNAASLLRKFASARTSWARVLKSSWNRSPSSSRLISKSSKTTVRGTTSWPEGPASKKSLGTAWPVRERLRLVVIRWRRANRSSTASHRSVSTLCTKAERRPAESPWRRPDTEANRWPRHRACPKPRSAWASPNRSPRRRGREAGQRRRRRAAKEHPELTPSHRDLPTKAAGSAGASVTGGRAASSAWLGRCVRDGCREKQHREDELRAPDVGDLHLHGAAVLEDAIVVFDGRAVAQREACRA